MASPNFPSARRIEALRARVHHQDVGTKLLEAPDQFLALAVFVDEIEQVEIALRVANHALEFVDLKKTQIAVVILNAFLLQFAALLGGELIIFAALSGTRGAALMIDEKGLAVVRTLAIGPAFHLHLQQAEVDPELQFFAAIQSEDFADLDRAGFVRPIFQTSQFKSRLMMLNDRTRVSRLSTG